MKRRDARDESGAVRSQLGDPLLHAQLHAQQLGVVGAGYVGLTVAACFAHMGHRVRCCEIDRVRLARLVAGEMPMAEPRLADMVADGIKSGNLTFTDDIAEACAPSEFVFIAVPTPLGADGEIEMTSVIDAAVAAASAMSAPSVLVLKSTVPVGGAAQVSEALRRAPVGPEIGPQIGLVSNPEFLREGSAVDDFLKPDRVVIGGEVGGVDTGVTAVAQLYRPLGAPVYVMDHASAALVKCASNSFLAAKVSFVNALATACEAVGADIDAVLTGVRADQRIGSAYMAPGPGWGGSCLPKDTRALWRSAGDAGYIFDLLKAVIEVNDEQPRRVVDKVVEIAVGRDSGGQRLTGVRVALLGLAFKAGTDDTRGSPALAVARLLADEGATLTAYDPAVSGPVSLGGAAAGEQPSTGAPGELVPSATAYDALAGAHVAVVLTEWSEFATLDWQLVAQSMSSTPMTDPGVVDARNSLNPATLRAAGFRYVGMGRSQSACA